MSLLLIFWMKQVQWLALQKMMRTVILNSRALNTKLVTLEQILQESEMTARPLTTL